MVTEIDRERLFEYREKSSLICKKRQMLQLGDTAAYNSLTAESLLMDSSALLSFHKTSYNKYLQHILAVKACVQPAYYIAAPQKQAERHTGS